MTQEEENQYLTCMSDGQFYNILCSYNNEVCSINDFKRWVKTCLIRNNVYSDVITEKTFKAIADNHREEMPKYSEMFKKDKTPEFISETKAYIKHKTAAEELLKFAKQINLNADRLINQGKLQMKYSSGFHTPTIYNNVDVKDLTKEDIMQAIRDEKAKIKSVEDLKESKTIQKQIKQSEDNIAKLLELLDGDTSDSE